MITKIKTVLKGLSQTWHFRRTQPRDYALHTQAIELEHQAIRLKYERDRASLSRELSIGTETRHAAGRAQARYNLVKVGAIHVSECDRDLLELDASLYSAPEALEKMVIEYEAYARDALILDSITWVRMTKLERAHDILVAEWELCVSARKGWFFALLRFLHLAS